MLDLAVHAASGDEVTDGGERTGREKRTEGKANGRKQEAPACAQAKPGNHAGCRQPCVYGLLYEQVPFKGDARWLRNPPV